MTDPVATWRMVVAGAIVTGLGLGLGAVALSSDPIPPGARPPKSLVTVPPATTSAETNSTAVPTTSPTEDVADEVRSAVAAALLAWGSFAGSGDLADVDPFFDHVGPQWAVLEGEAGSPGVPFNAELVEHSLELTDRTAVVTGTVTFVAGDEFQSADWQIELRSDAQGRWLIWSVREFAAG